MAALVAVAVVCAGLAVYAGVLADALPESSERNRAEIAADRVADGIEDAGVVEPANLSSAKQAVQGSYRVNVSLVAGDRRWRTGPSVSLGAETATRRASVVISPGRVRPGRLRVAVW